MAIALTASVQIIRRQLISIWRELTTTKAGCRAVVANAMAAGLLRSVYEKRG